MGVSNIDKGLKKREREVCRFGVRLFSMLIRRWTHSYIRLIALSLGFLVVVFFCMKAILSNLLCLLFKNKKKNDYYVYSYHFDFIQKRKPQE